MSQLPLNEIEGRVRGFLDQSPLARAVRQVSVKPIDDPQDESVLRIIVSLHQPDKVDVRAASDVVRRLRLDLMADDDRFFVFQFPEAA